MVGDDRRLGYLLECNGKKQASLAELLDQIDIITAFVVNKSTSLQDSFSGVTRRFNGKFILFPTCL